MNDEIIKDEKEKEAKPKIYKNPKSIEDIQRSTFKPTG